MAPLSATATRTVGEITELLQAARTGNDAAMDAVFERVYPLLRQLAGARLGKSRGEATLNPTALVHETYLKLVGARRLDLADRRHFFACVARAMRQIVIDHARARASGRRGGDAVRVPLVDAESIASDDAELVDLDAALDRLDEIAPPLRELVELRVFAGMTLEQLAETCGRSLRSVNRDWQRARALLIAQMG
jgi:RNA polymerase sigma factor (TIGR02999 family)